MKLIFENWRRYLNEAKANPSTEFIDKILKEHYTDGEWSVEHKLGAGVGGDVFLIQDYRTGERRALKFVAPTAPFFDTEGRNYEWVLKNRKSLPECARDDKGKKLDDDCIDVRKYLPKVFSVRKFDFGDVIQMEVLEPVPQRVLDDLFKTYPLEVTDRKAQVLLSDLDYVKKLIRKLVRHAVNQFSSSARIVKDEQVISFEPEEAFAIADAATESWEAFYNTSVNKALRIMKKEKGSNINADNVMPEFYRPPEEALEVIITDALTNRIRKFIVDAKKTIGKPNDPSFATLEISLFRALQPLDDNIQRILKRSPIPTWATDYTDEEYREYDLFPEARGMNAAMRILSKRYGFISADLHSANVMTRPGTNDLVAVDLGLFEIDPSSANPLAGPTFNPLAGTTFNPPKGLDGPDTAEVKKMMSTQAFFK